METILIKSKMNFLSLTKIYLPYEVVALGLFVNSIKLSYEFNRTFS
jgi:hypothetical protein